MRHGSSFGRAALVLAFLSPALAGEQKVPLDAVPRPVMDTVKARFAGAEVQDHPLSAGDPIGQLADVDVVGLGADDEAHGTQSTLGR